MAVTVIDESTASEQPLGQLGVTEPWPESTAAKISAETLDVEELTELVVELTGGSVVEESVAVVEELTEIVVEVTVEFDVEESVVIVEELSEVVVELAII